MPTIKINRNNNGTYDIYLNEQCLAIGLSMPQVIRKLQELENEAD